MGEGIDEALRAVVVLGATSSAVLWILRTALAYQRDFTGRYAARNAELEERVDSLELELDDVRALVHRCERRELVLIRLLAINGIDLPADYPA
jgi:hypothetical protein